MSSTGVNKKKEPIIVNKPTEVNFELIQYFQQYENNSTKGSFYVKAQNQTRSNSKRKITSKANNPFSSSKFTNVNKKSYDNKNSSDSDSKNNNNNNIKNYNNKEKNKDNKEKIAYFSTEQKGLDDNYLNDYQNKRKAKLGLLMIMNKYSGGEYCKDIKKYFDNLKKAADEKQLNKFIDELNNKNNEGEIPNKSYQRQNCFENLDNTDSAKVSGFGYGRKNYMSNLKIKKLSSQTYSKKTSDMELSFNPRNSFANYAFNKNLNNQKLPKIIEENNEYVLTKKKFTNDVNEEQLANFYYSIEEIEKFNSNIPCVSKDRRQKKELMRNLLLRDKKQSSIAAAGYVNNNAISAGKNSKNNFQASPSVANCNKINGNYPKYRNSNSISPNLKLRSFNYNSKKSINIFLRKNNDEANKVEMGYANQLNLVSKKKEKNTSFNGSSISG